MVTMVGSIVSPMVYPTNLEHPIEQTDREVYLVLLKYTWYV